MRIIENDRNKKFINKKKIFLNGNDISHISVSSRDKFPQNNLSKSIIAKDLEFFKPAIKNNIFSQSIKYFVI